MDILGIDIRTDALAVVHLKGSFLSLKALGHETFGGDTMEARLAGLKGYISRCAVKDPRIAVALPRNSTVFGIIDIPAQRHSAIGGILRFELEKHLPFKPDEAYWGFDVIAKKENIFSIIFAAARRNTVDTILAEFRASGLDPCFAGFWQASVGNALFHCKDSGGVVAVAGVGVKEATLDVLSDFVPVYSRSAGGAARLKDDFPAGALKRELGFFLRSKAPSSPARKIDRFALASGQAPEKRVLDELSRDLGLPVSALDLTGFNMPSTAAAALGAALSAAGKGRVNIDLLPSSAEKAAGPGYKLTLALSAAIAILLLLTGATYIVKDRLALYRLDSEVAEARAGKKRIQGLANALNDLSGRIRALEDIKGMNSLQPLDVIKELSVILPAGTWLTDYEYNGGVVFIEGFSGRASRELIEMERSGQIKDAEFVGPVTKGHDGKEHFRIRFKAVDYKEMTEAGKAGK